MNAQKIGSKILFENRALYFLMGVGLLIIFLAALGPGLYSSQPQAALGWQYTMFDKLCHQLADRSFYLNNIQMAVCTRCIGIYGSLLFGWILLFAISYITPPKNKWYKNLLIAAIVLNSSDVIGNYFDIWTNTDLTRLIFGIFFGAGIILYIHKDFFPKQKREEIL